MKTVAPYAALAAGYDVVMEHVDYEEWAGYVHDLIGLHHAAAASILELGCGTGSLAFELAPLGPYAYAGSDRAEAMVQVAHAKAAWLGMPIDFEVADFTNFRVTRPVDVVLLLFDGLNYLHTPAEVAQLLDHVAQALKPGGLFLFDQSTPANSLNNAEYFEDEGEADGFAYIRRSHYDPKTQLHTTSFDLTVEGEAYHEAHVQRAYERAELEPLFGAWEVAAAYDGFSDDPATDASERIHWVLRKPHRSPNPNSTP